MGLTQWIGEHGFDLLQSVGIAGALWFSALSGRAETKTRQMTNLIAMTQNHRELWRDFHRDPGLARVLDPSADVSARPVTRGEEEFVNIVIQHLSSVYHAILIDLTIEPEGIRRDVGEFFSLPIPRAVWLKAKPLQDNKLIQFVEECLNGTAESKMAIGLALQ